ncbi:MAG: monofunctional biosynthetic peptidoglycan transglycosylase, partial [Acidobacteriota bacterium]
MTRTRWTPLKVRLAKSGWRDWLRWIGLGIAGLWLLAAMLLVAAKWINPPTTMVRMERRVQGGSEGQAKRYRG